MTAGLALGGYYMAIVNSSWFHSSCITLLMMMVNGASWGLNKPAFDAMLIDVSTTENRKSIYSFTYWSNNPAISVAGIRLDHHMQDAAWISWIHAKVDGIHILGNLRTENTVAAVVLSLFLGRLLKVSSNAKTMLAAILMNIVGYTYLVCGNQPILPSLQKHPLLVSRRRNRKVFDDFECMLESHTKK